MIPHENNVAFIGNQRNKLEYRQIKKLSQGPTPLENFFVVILKKLYIIRVYLSIIMQVSLMKCCG